MLAATLLVERKPPRLAVAADKFAIVDDEDFGFALYGAREWEQDGRGVVRGRGNQKEITLARLIADRMELPSDVPVAHRDDNPLNCRRQNIYCTRYIWVRGTFTRTCKTTEVKTVGRGKKKREVEEEITTYVEETGWIYGNVALYQSNAERGPGGHWTLIHLPTGLGFGATWDRIAPAKLGVELIHVEADFSTLPDDGQFTPEMGAKWRDVTRRRRGH